MTVPSWPFTEAAVSEAMQLLRADRDLLILVQAAERYDITVADVRKRLAKDPAFREDVLLWLGLNKLRQTAQQVTSRQPKIAIAGSR